MHFEIPVLLHFSHRRAVLGIAFLEMVGWVHGHGNRVALGKAAYSKWQETWEAILLRGTWTRGGKTGLCSSEAFRKIYREPSCSAQQIHEP